MSLCWCLLGPTVPIAAADGDNNRIGIDRRYLSLKKLNKTPDEYPINPTYSYPGHYG